MIKWKIKNYMEFKFKKTGIKFEYTPDTRKYPGQQCQDEELTKKFRAFHEELVNKVISFCKDNNILIDEFHLNADSLEDSIKFGSWQACTDSCFSFEKFTDEYKKAFIYMDRDFLKGKDQRDLDIIHLEQEPYLCSM